MLFPIFYMSLHSPERNSDVLSNVPESDASARAQWSVTRALRNLFTTKPQPRRRRQNILGVESLEDRTLMSANPIAAEVSNIASEAEISASSVLSSRYNPQDTLVDGVVQKHARGEWASRSETSPVATLEWDQPMLVSGVTLFDRVASYSWAQSATLTFSDGSSLSIDNISNDGSAQSLTFPEKLTTSLRIQLHGEGIHIGLAEVEVQGRPAIVDTPDDPDSGEQVPELPPYENLAKKAHIEASSTKSSRYAPEETLIDEVMERFGRGEWASDDETNPVVSMQWDEPVTIDSVSLYDRKTSRSWTERVDLVFDDGTRIPVEDIQNSGEEASISFAEKTTSSLRLELHGSGRDVGLAEVEVYGRVGALPPVEPPVSPEPDLPPPDPDPVDPAPPLPDKEQNETIDRQLMPYARMFVEANGTSMTIRRSTPEATSYIEVIAHTVYRGRTYRQHVHSFSYEHPDGEQDATEQFELNARRSNLETQGGQIEIIMWDSPERNTMQERVIGSVNKAANYAVTLGQQENWEHRHEGRMVEHPVTPELLVLHSEGPNLLLRTSSPYDGSFVEIEGGGLLSTFELDHQAGSAFQTATITINASLDSGVYEVRLLSRQNGAILKTIPVVWDKTAKELYYAPDVEHTSVVAGSFATELEDSAKVFHGITELDETVLRYVNMQQTQERYLFDRSAFSGDGVEAEVDQLVANFKQRYPEHADHPDMPGDIRNSYFRYIDLMGNALRTAVDVTVSIRNGGSESTAIANAKSSYTLLETNRYVRELVVDAGLQVPSFNQVFNEGMRLANDELDALLSFKAQEEYQQRRLAAKSEYIGPRDTEISVAALEHNLNVIQIAHERMGSDSATVRQVHNGYAKRYPLTYLTYKGVERDENVNPREQVVALLGEEEKQEAVATREELERRRANGEDVNLKAAETGVSDQHVAFMYRDPQVKGWSMTASLQYHGASLDDDGFVNYQQAYATHTVTLTDEEVLSLSREGDLEFGDRLVGYLREKEDGGVLFDTFSPEQISAARTVVDEAAQDVEIDTNQNLSTAEEGSDQWRRENVILSNLKEHFILEDPEKWRWDLGSPYHRAYNTTDEFHAVDLNLGSGHSDYGESVKLVADGVIEHVNVKYGIVRIRHEITDPADSNNTIVWYSQYTHLPIEQDADGSKWIRQRESVEGGNIVWERQITEYQEVKQSEGQFAAVGNNGTGFSHMHYVAMDSQMQSIDLRKVLVGEFGMRVTATDGGIDGVYNGGDSSQRQYDVVWNGQLEAWTTKNNGPKLVYDRSMQHQSGDEGKKVYWLAWEEGKAVSEMERVVWKMVDNVVQPDGSVDRVGLFVKLAESSNPLQYWNAELGMFVNIPFQDNE